MNMVGNEYIRRLSEMAGAFLLHFYGSRGGSFFCWRKAGEGCGIQDSGDYGGDWRGYYEALQGV